MATVAPVSRGALARLFGPSSAWTGAFWTPLMWTSLALGGSVLLHVDRVPFWIAAVAYALILWRLAASIRAVRLPGKVVRAFMAFALVGAVFAHFHTLNGLGPGTALLLLMAAIKLLETQSARDEYIVVGGSLFLLLAACLDRQGLLRTPLYLLEAWLCCATFAVIAYSAESGSASASGRAPATASARGAASKRAPATASAQASGSDAGPAAASGEASVESATPPRHSGSFSNRAAVMLAGRALLYSLPLALVLFVFFPRLPGAFWALPRSEAAETGLSDTMSPGSISQLTSSYEIAFRAKFDGPTPPAPARYWRGPVLHDFDGYTWKRRLGASYQAQPLEYVGPAYHYRVSLEPSQQRWWFSLDTIDHSPDPNVFFTYDYELMARDPVTETTSYNAVSHTTTRPTQPLSRLARQVETALPVDRNPRSVQLAREMRGRVDSDKAFIGAVLQYFQTGRFVYSLTPPRLDFDSVDDFIFNTRSGFCGHYASAFVTLMRGAGVPARVVTGYLGGEWNPIGGYFIIRQSDAHSWAEVWLDGRGWTRVDPTAVVEPDRLTRGILDLLPDAGSAESRFVRASPGIAELLQRWDAVNTWWTDHVLKFDYRSQLNLLSGLGIGSPDLATLGWIFVAALLVWLGWIAWQMGRSAPRARPDRLARAYERLCKKLARIGLPRLVYQGPLDYASAVSARRPDLTLTVRALLMRYAELRYGAPRDASRTDDVAEFERAVSRLRVDSDR